MLPHRLLSSLIAGPWILWLIYWAAAAARDNKAIQRQESVASRLSYSIPIWLGAWLMLGRGLPPGFLTTRFIEGGKARFLAYCIGVIVLIAGLAFSVWARRALGDNWTVAAAQKESHELIQRGPYAIARHPIYTGIVVAVLGTALAIHQWRGVVALVLMTAGLAYKARIEERFMVDLFPDAYPAYRARVKALFPGVY